MAVSVSHGRVLGLLLRLRRRFRARRLLTAVLWWIASLPLLLLFLLIEHFSSHDPAVRPNACFSCHCCFPWLDRCSVVAGAARGDSCCVLHRIFTIWHVASAGEVHKSAIDCLNGLQVVEAGELNVQGYDPELIAASLDSVVPQLANVDVTHALPRRPLRLALMFCVTSLVLAAGVLLGAHESAELGCKAIGGSAAEFPGSSSLSIDASCRQYHGCRWAQDQHWN